MTKWGSILVALLGLALAVYTVATHGRDRPPDPPPAAPPSINPYPQGIAATGQVEAASRNIALSAADAGLVTEVLVQVGDLVKAGQVVARLDDRLLVADKVRLAAARDVSAARLARLRAQPRRENLPPLQAAVNGAKALLADAQDLLEDLNRAGVGNAASPAEIARRQFAVNRIGAEVAAAEANLALAAAGAWGPDVLVSEAELKQSEAELKAIDTRLDRLAIRSPIDGTVLKRNIEPGQYTSTGSVAQAALVVGDLRALRVRARVDEEDAPMLVEMAAATLRVRGITGETAPLKMVRIEPLALPKQDLVNSTTERVDTRVVEVVFEVTGVTRARLFPGQVVDVFIDASGVIKEGTAGVKVQGS